ncbi:MAG: hypothetical protein LC776_03895 [Acidobacteria bacterium]|nr:hypothetical protein [Acidobacteriota bacterium]
MTRFSTKSPILKLTMMIVVTAITAQLTTLPLGAATFQGTVLQTTEVVIPDGTEFTVVTIEEITSKTATEGDPISFKVDEDVKVNGRTVIAKDTLVKGMVASAKKSGFFGRGGNLGIRIESTMTVDSQKVKLRSVKGKEGGDKTGTTVALVVLFGPLGFLKKGKNAIIKTGTQIKVFTDEEKKVQLKS